MVYTHFLYKKGNHQSLSGQAKMDNLSKIENIPPQRSEKDSVTKNLVFTPKFRSVLSSNYAATFVHFTVNFPEFSVTCSVFNNILTIT